MKYLSFKLTLIISGLLALLMMGGNLITITFVMTVSLLAYYSANNLSNHLTEKGRQIIYRSAVPVTFFLIVILNFTGFIGTLTGSNQVNERFLWLLAAPFYFLSIASYFSDVASGKLKPVSMIDYLVFILMPFKLLSGPIESTSIIKQIENLNPRFRVRSLMAGWPWIAVGLFMKYVIANRLNPTTNLDLIDPLSSLITALIFELKFYFDFGGYSLCAYGLALIFNLKITRNFNHPLFSPNVVIFWRRWHISLGRFLSRYILDANIKKIKNRKVREFFIAGIFIVSALWHGGTINYVFWGLFHGICYYTYIKYLKRKQFPKIMGLLCMVLFLIMGRMLAVDAQTKRLVDKICNLFNPLEYFKYLNHTPSHYIITNSEIKALALSVFFLALEFISLKIYSEKSGYHLLRKPLIALPLLAMVFLYSIPNGKLLYARI